MIINDSKYSEHWAVKPLNKLGDFSRWKSKHRPRNDEKLFVNGKYPFIQTWEIKSANMFIKKHNWTYNEFWLNQSKIWKEWTLCITIAANIAETAILEYPMCFPDSIVWFNAFPDESSEIFMYYLFSYIKKAIQNSASWSIQDNINIDYLTGLRLRIPNKDYQNKIVEVLESIDFKIENNIKINLQLEEMAKTLYGYWFFQFDFPDENWNPYKSSGWKMVWNEELKREIPEGWEVKKMKDLLKKNNKKFHLNWNKHNLDTIDLSTMPNWTMCLDNRSSSDDFSTNLFELNKYDILFWWIRPYLLKAWFSPFDWLVTWTVHSFKVKNIHDYNFSLISMIQDSIFNFAVANSKWTKMPIIWVDDLLDYKVAYNEDIVRKYNEIISFREIISKNITKNQKLWELRDWLLPMLMNWQVSVK